jgi:hypothetical protein
MTATGSGASLAFTGSPTITVNGTPITIPTLTVTGSSKDSGSSVIPSGPSAAELAAQALVANRVLAGKATVSGTEIRLTGNVVTITADDEVEIPAGVTLVVPQGKTLSIATGAELKVAENATLEIEGTGNIDFGATGTIDNDGTIELNTHPDNFEAILANSTGDGKIKLNAKVAEVEGLGGPLELGQALEIADGGSIKFDDESTGAAFSNNKTVTIDAGGELNLGAGVTSLGATIVNNGTVTTSTTTGTTLKTILDNVTGNITASGTGIEIPAGGATVKPGTTLKVSGSLKVPTTTGLTLQSGSSKVVVEGTGTLDLSELLSSDTDAVALNGGTIEVAENGTFLGPVPIATGEDKAGQTPQIDWAGGSIVFNKGSKGYFGAVEDDEYYIGAADGDGARYQWDATNPGTVTLKGDELILEGYLTSAKDNYIADTATIKDGAVLTVAKTLTLAASAELDIAEGAKVVVNGDGGVLDLQALYVADENGADTASGKVTLDGDIEVESGGTLKISMGNGTGVIPEIDWTAGGSVKIEKGGSVTLEAGNPGDEGDITYIGESGLYEWDAQEGDASVTLSENKMELAGNITANNPQPVAAGITATVNGNLTVKGSYRIDGTIEVLGKVKVTTSEFTLDKDEANNTSGRLIIRDGGEVEFDATSRIVLAGDGTPDYSGDNFKVGFKVADSSDDDDYTATKATVAKTDAVPGTSPALWTVTSGGDGTNLLSAPIVLGQTTVAFNGTSNVDTKCKIYTQVPTSAAAGSIKAGTGTAIIFSVPEEEED